MIPAETILDMPEGAGSTSDNYVFSSTHHSHSRTHSVTMYNVVDQLVGIGTLSFLLVSSFLH